jgi:hypothetical protein
MSIFLFQMTQKVHSVVQTKPHAWRVVRWSEVGKRTGTDGILLLSTTALLMSLIQTPLSESGSDKNISVHTPLDRSEY